MSHMLYVNRSSCSERGETVEWSVIGFAQFSLNSSKRLSSEVWPANQERLPDCFRPPELAICLAQTVRERLYSSRWGLWILKKMWSSTHLSKGPMPWDLKISAPVSARRPYTPAAGVEPKARHESTMNLSSDARITAAGHWEGWSGMVR